MTDKHAIAEWLIGKIHANGERRSYQSHLVQEMRRTFGNEWSYTNHNGNQAIDKGVLSEFGKLKDEFVYWDSSNQSWRIVTQDELDRLESRAADRKLRREETARRRAEWEAERAS